MTQTHSSCIFQCAPTFYTVNLSTSCVLHSVLFDSIFGHWLYIFSHHKKWSGQIIRTDVVPCYIIHGLPTVDQW